MESYNTSLHVPVHNLDAENAFHLIYKFEETDRDILKVWYSKSGDFFFYPNMQAYNTLIMRNNQIEAVSRDTESEHPRITIHESGVIVGPDKTGRNRGQKYERLPESIKDSEIGVRLGNHRVAGPGLYKAIRARSMKKGNWVRFNVKGSNIQPVISIDAFPFYDDSDVSKLPGLENAICGFFTKHFSQKYRVLIIFNLTEEQPNSDMKTHEVYLPVRKI